MSLYSDAATQFATRDPRPAADHILNTACQKALNAIRVGETEQAREQLEQAAQRAHRLLAHAPHPEVTTC